MSKEELTLDRGAQRGFLRDEMIRFQNLLASITEFVYETEIAYKRQELFCKILERALFSKVFESPKAIANKWPVDMKKSESILESISREELLARHGLEKIIPNDKEIFTLAEEKSKEIELEANWNKARNRMAAINVTIDVARSGLSFDKLEIDSYGR